MREVFSVGYFFWMQKLVFDDFVDGFYHGIGEDHIFLSDYMFDWDFRRIDLIKKRVLSY
jgi:hypothetical protein